MRRLLFASLFLSMLSLFACETAADDAKPMEAVFDQANRRTTYTIKIEDESDKNTTVLWFGTTCDTKSEQSVGSRGTQNAYAFIWNHPHSPCSNVTDHRDATIQATVDNQSRMNPRALYVRRLRHRHGPSLHHRERLRSDVVASGCE